MSQSQSEEIYNDVRSLLSELDEVHDELQDHAMDTYFLHGPVSFDLIERIREMVN